MARLQAFGPYQLVERIGVGAMGEVYRAVSRRDGRVVALKRLMNSQRDSADAIAMIEAEADLARVLDHPAVHKLADVGEVDGVRYIAYDYVHGRDLRAIQQRTTPRRGTTPPRRPTLDGPRPPPTGEPVPLDVAVAIVLRVAEALAHAHGRTDRQGKPLGLVHRDVSPTNVLVAFDGTVKLLDFGIARSATQLVHTITGQVKGTVGYMSPEQGRGETVDARSDVYALAVCFWELVCGRRLIDTSQPQEQNARILAGNIPSARESGAAISEGMERVLRKALAQSREDRYASASDFHAALSRQAGADGLLLDSVRVARYVRSVFPEAAAEEAASREESLDMADNKGGSDLDVFEGLAKKASRPTAPGLTPPPSGQPQQRKSTLLGGLGPLPPPVAPPNSTKSAPPPAGFDGGSRPQTPGHDSGSRPQAAGPLPAPLPPPPSKAPSLPPPVAPPGKSGTLPATSAPLPPPAAPPPPKSGTLPGLAGPPAALPPPSMPAAPPPVAAPPMPLPPPGRPPFPPAPSAAAAPPLPPPAAPPAKTPLPPPGVLPPPAPPPEKAAGKASVDMDWDDEEESTHVYDKAEHGALPRPKGKVGAAAALLASSGGAARPPPTNAPSVPPPPPVPVTAYAEPMMRRDDPTAVRPRAQVAQQTGGGTGRMGVILGGAALVVALAVLVFTLMPKKGDLKITVSAKNGATVGAVDVYVDGQKKCEATPCVVTMEPGAKTIKVIAPGFPPAEAMASVEAGNEKLVSIPLEAGGATPAGTQQVAVVPSNGGPVLKISGTDQEKIVHVLVDGADKGTLPIEIKDVPAGTHKVRLDGGDRYEKLERSVDLSAGQTNDLGEIKLKVLKGQVTLDVVTQGADVKLVRRGDKKVEKKVKDDVRKIDIDTSENWRIVATKKGFDDFTQDLTFEDGQAEKTIKVELFEIGKPAPPTTNIAPINTDKGTDKPPPQTDKGTDKGTASGTGTLNINSIPVSKVILDGKPLGSTPKVGVSVSAGSHTVTFIHPDLGKQSVTVQVKGGETKTAAVKFKQ